MSGPKPVVLMLLCLGTTAVTYLLMHMVVAPRLAMSAVDVPSLVGMMPEQARILAETRGLLLVLDGERAVDDAKPGALCEQTPLVGSRLHVGEKVHAFVARPQPALRVPALLGQTVEAAGRALTEQGFKVGPPREVDSTAVAPGLVAETQPAAGAEAHKGDTVVLGVARGALLVAVPDVRGRRPSSAREALEQAGLLVGSQRAGVDDNAADGVVLRQSPSAGTQVPKGQKIDLVVNE